MIGEILLFIKFWKWLHSKTECWNTLYSLKSSTFSLAKLSNQNPPIYYNLQLEGYIRSFFLLTDSNIVRISFRIPNFKQKIKYIIIASDFSAEEAEFDRLWPYIQELQIRWQIDFLPYLYIPDHVHAFYFYFPVTPHVTT